MNKTDRMIVIVIEARLDELSQLPLQELPLSVSTKILDRKYLLLKEYRKRMGVEYESSD